MNARWLTGLTIAAALTCAAVQPAPAQQTLQGVGFPTLGARAGTFATTPAAGVAPIAPRTFFPNMARPLGVVPLGARPFFPSIGSPLSFSAAGVRPFFPDIRAPLSVGFNPVIATPFFPDVRQSLSGTFVPATAFPFGSTIPSAVVPSAVIDPRASLSRGFNPVVGTPSLSRGFNPSLANPTIRDVRAPLSAFSQSPAAATVARGASAFGRTDVPSTLSGVGTFVGGGVPTTVFIDANGFAVPSPVAAPFPFAVTPQAAVAVTGGRPIARRQTVRRAIARDARAVQDAQRLMAQVPLTEGKAVSSDARGVRVRVTSRTGSQIRRYPAAQVFFFLARSELMSAARQGRPARGQTVLVPATAVVALR